MNDDDLKVMVLNYMDDGYLENIIDMFKHDEALYPLVIDMISDERVRVRLGATALVEELVKTNRNSLIKLIPAIAGLLDDPNPTRRGDAAYLLGIIHHTDALPYLLKVRNDENVFAREIIIDSIQDITGNN
ncbi:MAG TPA: HEAT repeat domain-containing protein [Dissulfurispiraceae bacterium]|nr:HEAT repeat domain-containing protein [Dissulfurispiraceae bacterium]